MLTLDTTRPAIAAGPLGQDLPAYGHAAPDKRAMSDAFAAWAYEGMPHQPRRPVVAASYRAFIGETKAQWADIRTSGLRVDFHDGSHDYPTSAAMFADIEAGHLWTRASYADGLPGNHPMAAFSGIYGGIVTTADTFAPLPLMVNDIFRAVHDVNGHYAGRHSFGPNGERNAWLRHRQTYSAEALAALWCETRGQGASYAVHHEFAEQKAGWPLEYLV